MPVKRKKKRNRRKMKVKESSDEPRFQVHSVGDESLPLERDGQVEVPMLDFSRTGPEDFEETALLVPETDEAKFAVKEVPVVDDSCVTVHPVYDIPRKSDGLHLFDVLDHQLRELTKHLSKRSTGAFNLLYGFERLSQRSQYLTFVQMERALQQWWMQQFRHDPLGAVFLEAHSLTSMIAPRSVKYGIPKRCAENIPPLTVLFGRKSHNSDIFREFHGGWAVSSLYAHIVNRFTPNKGQVDVKTHRGLGFDAFRSYFCTHSCSSENSITGRLRSVAVQKETLLLACIDRDDQRSGVLAVPRFVDACKSVGLPATIESVASISSWLDFGSEGDIDYLQLLSQLRPELHVTLFTPSSSTLLRVDAFSTLSGFRAAVKKHIFWLVQQANSEGEQAATSGLSDASISSTFVLTKFFGGRDLPLRGEKVGSMLACGDVVHCRAPGRPFCTVQSGTARSIAPLRAKDVPSRTAKLPANVLRRLRKSRPSKAASRLQTIRGWTVEDVCDWLSSLKAVNAGIQLFFDNNIDGAALLSLEVLGPASVVAPEWLTGLSPLQTKKILLQVAKLQKGLK